MIQRQPTQTDKNSGRPPVTHKARKAARWQALAITSDRDAREREEAIARELRRLSGARLVNCVVSETVTPREAVVALQYHDDPRVFAELLATRSSDVKLKAVVAGAVTNLLNGQKNERTTVLREAVAIIRFQEKAEEIALDHATKPLDELRTSAAQLLSNTTAAYQRANLATAFYEAAVLCPDSDRSNLMTETGRAFLTGSTISK